MKRTRAATLLALTALMIACEGGDVAIFATVAGGSSTGGSASGGFAGSGAPAAGGDSALDGGLESGPPPCTTIADCPGPGWLCTKQGCSAMDGVCVPVPVFCPDDAVPVCGCDDNVTYWNDCVRQQAGESASASGECGEGARVCTTSADCPTGATCSHLLLSQSSCGQPGPGNCWVTPFTCPSAADSGGNSGTDSRYWVPCGGPPPGTGGPPPCTSTCEAIQAGRPYQPLAPGTQCY